MKFLDRDTPLHYRASIYMGKQYGGRASWALVLIHWQSQLPGFYTNGSRWERSDRALLGVFLIRRSREALMMSIWG